MKRAEITVEIAAEFTHYYPAAAADPKLTDVSYLANLHHHHATIRLSLEVRHADRDIELHQLRRWLLSCFSPQPVAFGAMSCERICDWVQQKVVAQYPGRAMKVSVFEDAYVGATVQYDAEVAS